MPVPNHGPGCRTWTWRTQCLDCGDPVWFFACNCGSKIFFDALGGDWPRHGERCLAYLFRQLRESEGLSFDQITNLVRQKARDLGQEVPRAALLAIEQQRYAVTGKARVIDVEPGETEAVIFGRVSAIDAGINMFRRLKLPDNAISRQLIGILGSVEYSQVTIVEDPDPRTGLAARVTCLYPRKAVREIGLRPNDLVIGYLETVERPGGIRVVVFREIVKRSTRPS